MAEKTSVFKSLKKKFSGKQLLATVIVLPIVLFIC